jgi:RNA polymerase sigma-70 factor (ECF subfamily)
LSKPHRDSDKTPSERVARFKHFLGAAGRRIDDDEVRKPLDRAVDEARRAWPRLELSEGDFIEHLAQHVGAEPVAALTSLHAADLYLACACARGDSKAISAFEKRFFPEVADAIARLDGSGTLKDDVQQMLREKLFVGRNGGRPKIADYSGRGPLAGWACAAGLRTALSVRRQERREVPLEDEPLLELPSNDPELEFIKSMHQRDFRVALQDAFRALTSRERNVMRLHLVDGLNIDEIGTLYRAHRSTVARWIQRSRQTLFEQTRKILMERLKLRGSELDSLFRLLHSQLDASIARFLKSKP